MSGGKVAAREPDADEAIIDATGAPESSPRESAGLRRLSIRVLIGVVLLALLGPIAVDAGAGVWTSAIALGAAYSLTAVGVYLTFRILDFPDLTVDASFPAGGAMAAVLITNGLSPWLSLPGAFALGAAFGVLTALLHLFLRINSLLASILTVTAAFTINLRVQGRANVPLLGVDTIYTPLLEPVRDLMEEWFGETGNQIHRNVTTMLVAGTLLAVVIAALRMFFRTEVGIAMRATGANPRMSRAQGIDTRIYIVLGVGLSNGLIAVSGVMVAQHQGFADVSSGAGLIIAGLAAVIIGEVLFVGRSASVGRHLVAVCLGMIVYRAAIGLTLSSDIDLPLLPSLQLEPTDVRLATAVVVAGLLAVPRVRDWQRSRGTQ